LKEAAGEKELVRQLENAAKERKKK